MRVVFQVGVLRERRRRNVNYHWTESTIVEFVTIVADFLKANAQKPFDSVPSRVKILCSFETYEFK